MVITLCGFNNSPGAAGNVLLEVFGPTLAVQIGFDPTYDPQNPGRPPALPQNPIHALVDTGALDSCIDTALAMSLNLPIVDRRTVSGVHSTNEVNMHLAHLHVPSLMFTYGIFAGVSLRAGGQQHQALIGRSFLKNFTMVYEGRTGTVTIHNN
jgi:gag-polyprotein putative aspartyl protease